MLWLDRKKGASVTIKGRGDNGPGVIVHVLKISGGKVRLGFEAPPGSIVLRSELPQNEPALSSEDI